MKTFKVTFCAWALLCAGATASAASCTTLKAEFVGFGERSSRAYAEQKLEREIADWEDRTGVKATPRNRKTECEVYLQILNEYLCAAEAVVCR